MDAGYVKWWESWFLTTFTQNTPLIKIHRLQLILPNHFAKHKTLILQLMPAVRGSLRISWRMFGADRKDPLIAEEYFATCSWRMFSSQWRERVHYLCQFSDGYRKSLHDFCLCLRYLFTFYHGKSLFFHHHLGNMFFFPSTKQATPRKEIFLRDYENHHDCPCFLNGWNLRFSPRKWKRTWNVGGFAPFLIPLR